MFIRLIRPRPECVQDLAAAACESCVQGAKREHQLEAHDLREQVRIAKDEVAMLSRSIPASPRTAASLACCSSESTSGAAVVQPTCAGCIRMSAIAGRQSACRSANRMPAHDLKFQPTLIVPRASA